VFYILDVIVGDSLTDYGGYNLGCPKGTTQICILSLRNLFAQRIFFLDHVVGEDTE